MRRVKTVSRVLVAVFFVLIVASCESNNKSQADHEKAHSEMTDNKTQEKATHANEKVPVNHKISIKIIDSYLLIKNGLVADSKPKASQGAETMLAAFTNMDLAHLPETTLQQYMEIHESAKEHAEHIKKSSIDHQREHFEILTTDVIDLVALLGTDKTLYQDFCPMANNNKGAFWLSEIEEIKNPYYGAKMLSCGTVKKQIN